MKKHIAVAVAVLAIGAMTAGAGIIITPDHIVVGGNYTVQGTLVVIDVPSPNFANVSSPYIGDGDSQWTDEPASEVYAHAADNGFHIVSGVGIRSEQYGDSNWEPDGTPFGQSKNWAAYNPTTALFEFNLASCGIDIPDGAVIHGVYTTWDKRNDTAFYTYTEGSQSDTISFSYGSLPASDIILSWTDDLSTARTANFQRIFAGDITVGGGDGFVLEQQRRPNTAHLDAVVLDVTVPEPATLTMLGIFGLAVLARRRLRG